MAKWTSEADDLSSKVEARAKLERELEELMRERELRAAQLGKLDRRGGVYASKQVDRRGFARGHGGAEEEEERIGLLGRLGEIQDEEFTVLAQLRDEVENLTMETESSFGSAYEEPQAETMYYTLFGTLGLTEKFSKSFWSRKKSSEFGDNETDLGWIHLIMAEKYECLGTDKLSTMSTAEVLEFLGYTPMMARSYGKSIDNSVFKDSETMFGWALLGINESGLFDYDTGNFVQSGNSSQASGRTPEKTRPSIIQGNVNDNRVTVTSMKRLMLFGDNNPLTCSEFERKMDALKKDGSSLWFHATTKESVSYILRDGIYPSQGRPKKDFSSSNGFYVCNNPLYARSYCQHRHDQPVSIIIFQLRDGFLQSHGLDLRFKFTLELGDNGEQKVKFAAETDREKYEEWKKVIRHYRGLSGMSVEDEPYWRDIDCKHFIVGPVSDNAERPTLRRPPSDGDQLCIKTVTLARMLERCAIGIVHFEQDDAGMEVQ